MTSVNVYRDGKVYVRANQCDRCLFSKARLVDRDRAAALIQSTLVDGGSFVCHRHEVSDEPESICSIWYQRYGSRVMELRLAEVLGVIEMVEGAEDHD